MDGVSSLYSALSHYLVQSIVHSLIIALVVEGLLRSWRVRNPIYVSSFRLLILLLPPVTAILYQIAFPWRNSPEFRENGALFDSTRWIGDLTRGVGPLWYILFLIMLVSTILFVIQELIPTFSYHLLSRKYQTSAPVESFPKLTKVLASLSLLTPRMPEVLVVNHPEPIAYVPGTACTTLIISPALMDLLDEEEIEGVLAHEVAHVVRRDNWRSWIIFFMRSFMFFNPLAALIFHQVVQDTEKACDDHAVALTGKPLAFGSALIKTYKASTSPADHVEGPAKWLAVGVTSLENRARRFIVEDRVLRIVRHHAGRETSYVSTRLALTAFSLMFLLYYVV